MWRHCCTSAKSNNIVIEQHLIFVSTFLNIAVETLKIDIDVNTEIVR